MQYDQSNTSKIKSSRDTVMSSDTFFSQTNCDRCGSKLTIRTMSWFTEETICMECKTKESAIRAKLPDNGTNWEGCGYIPNQI